MMDGLARSVAERPVVVNAETIAAFGIEIEALQRPEQVQPIAARGQGVDLASAVCRPNRRSLLDARADHVAIIGDPPAVAELAFKQIDEPSWSKRIIAPLERDELPECARPTLNHARFR